MDLYSSIPVWENIPLIPLAIAATKYGPCSQDITICLRTVAAMKSGISVVEDFELSQYLAPTRLVLMTTQRDALKHISYNANQLEATRYTIK